ncbi:MAG: class I SAM-dependent methyltransferase [Burkholderia sp.]|jgi:cyclopropane-fatty-acyl-phospholipid synthase|uniref:SAM-dependent methyltransferase n=1 Tax=Burkholderia TaxID=32008 RepID=UPI001CF29CB0|nr:MULTISPECIES: cyclopropane-fatty-acyl-phospholipid synthase family protein [Burkholderia]MCA3777440.1 class I SAM-dependent methyltransferase [Burkholderia sp.]MCA3792383.1 class I SAM-dependent methyltransferase [Burkholderia sp.]MCA3803041.1 class I SAM-dependent methyltransferase [Burkholderia sp.]MCA3811749.1 class I SAM-dependent methyltransferase [Burkholderia sp.]MCA3816765.1 class I SAM-dependent methyltransferase [Burkholderia sp.]
MTAVTTRPSVAQPAAAPDGFALRCAERGRVPDALLRIAMRALLRQRLRDEHAGDAARCAAAFETLLAELRASPIAIDTQAANAQHYELPAAFFDAHLGPRAKYSCGYYPRGDETLAQAEDAMLALYAERADLADGQRILDLGCGWGSLSLWLAERFPHAQVVGLSNSHGQRAFIEQRAALRGLANLRIVTGNVADFEFAEADADAGFDRVLSVEMFEHMKHYGLLLAKIARWMRDDGRLFVHLFAHRLLAYHFAVRDGSDWMSRHFFTGGTMPSAHLLLRFQDDLCVTRQWWLDGTHYARTANQWLASLDAAREQVMPILADVYGSDARLWFQRWRMFYMAVAELFGYASGQEWGVAHYLFEKRSSGI